MTTETKRPFAHLTLIELLIGIVLLIGAGIFLVHHMRQAKHREQQRLIIQALDDLDGDTVLKLVKANPSLWSAKGNNGLTPLHAAAWFNAKDVAELLIAKGADVNAKDNLDETPLHEAAYYNAKDVAELLIAKGADVTVKDSVSWTPLQHAISRGNPALADLLRAHGATER